MRDPGSPATTPRGPVEWETLLRDALQRAESVGDRRAAGLRAALGTGRAERVLRKLGMVGSVDIDREFPV
jgi:hypothetical protein